MLKFNSLTKLKNKFEENILIHPNTQIKFSLLKLLVTVLYSAHIITCIWLFVCRMESEQGTISWMEKSEVEDSEWYIKYLYSYYFTTVTMVSVGYGDITPASNSEKVIGIGTMLFTCGVFGYTMNKIGSIFD